MDAPAADPVTLPSNSPFTRLTHQWLSKIKAARTQKKEFSRDGEECMRFFRGPYDFLYGLKEGVPQSGDFVFVGESGSAPRPAVAMTLNKVAEAVQIFGPALYHRNPVRTITPRELPMLPIEAIGDSNNPQVQQQFQQWQQQINSGRATDQARAALLQWYQDYTPTATDLKTESRNAIDEALIKGMGVLWTELWKPAASNMRITGSFYDSVDHLLIDCDAEQRNLAKWVSRTRTIPVWEFEAKYNLPHGSVKGSAESYGQKEFVEREGGLGEMAKREGKTNDLITYYEIYSKMGMGTLMSKTDWDYEKDAAELDKYGQFCYLVVCKELEFPANIHPNIWGNDAEIAQAVQWPIPFWADDAWPYRELVFHEVPNQCWPMSHFKPAMGELKFLNWAYSFLASRMKKSSRDILVCQKAAGEEMKRVLLSGEDYELVEIEKMHGTIKEMVQVLQFPEINGDMFKVIQLVTTLFEQRTGLSELMYGATAHAYRSAEEASVKENQLNVRPDDMVNKTEDWMSGVARSEALTARWMLDPQRDILPLMGPLGAQWWGQYIAPTDPTEILHQLEYRIEANSARKPNLQKEVADANQAMQSMFTPLMKLAQEHGVVGPVNALITRFANANQWDATPFLLPQPPPPPPPPPDKPKIAVSVDFATLTPDIQNDVMQMAGVMPPPPQLPPGVQMPPPLPLTQAKPAPTKQPEPGAADAANAKIMQMQQEGQLKAGQMQQEGAIKTQQMQQEGAIKVAQMHSESAMKAHQVQQEGAINAQKAQQEMAVNAMKVHQEGAINEQKAHQEMTLNKQKMHQDELQSHQNIAHKEADHKQAARHGDEMHKQDVINAKKPKPTEPKK